MIPQPAARCATPPWCPGRRQADAPQSAPIHQITDASAERRAAALTFAIISAAKADGHIDAAEGRAIEAELAALPDTLRGTLTSALLRPSDPSAVAALAQTDQERREIYAASVIATGKDHPDELVYMDWVACALGLPADQVAGIEEGL